MFILTLYQVSIFIFYLKAFVYALNSNFAIYTIIDIYF